MKNIILCFDGTGNEPNDADQKKEWLGLGDMEDNSISNVLKLHLLLGGDLQKTNVFGDQMSFYYSGVGTYGSWLNKLKNKISAPPEKDVGDIIKAGMKDLYKHYESGDKLFIFGFSRGAAIARRFVSVLKDTSEAFGWEEAPNVDFIGVFDTVAAIKKPNLFKEEIKPASDVVFENGTVSSLVKKALHLISLDERRITFMPTLMNYDNDRVTEVWLSGAHSDVGGGYYYDGLSDHALEFMIDFISRDENLDLKFLVPSQVKYDDLFEASDEVIEYEDVVVLPNIIGKNHEQSALTGLKESLLDHRTPRINVNDKHSIHAPIIHRSVFDRIIIDSEYNPEALTEKYLKNPYTDKLSKIKVWEYDNQCIEYDTIQKALELSNINLKTLEIGESINVKVFSNIKYNRTGIYFGRLANESYRFSIDMNQEWYDASIRCNPNGWDRNDNSLGFLQKQFIRVAESRKRCGDANWFEIVGTIGKNDDTCFKVLENQTNFTPYIKGELFLFANDLLSKYGNNRGSIIVNIERIS